MIRVELEEHQYTLLMYALGLAGGFASNHGMPAAKDILELTQHIMNTKYEV